MKKSPTTTSRRSSLTRQRILDGASRVFAEEGFAGAGVDRIALEAGVNKALLYYHVGNKQALYTAVLIRNFDRIERAFAAGTATGGSARDRLTAVIAAISRMLQTYPDHPRIVLREFASGGSNLQPEVLERMAGIVATVGRLLTDGVSAGEFRATEPVLTHLTLIGASLILNAVAPLRERLIETSSDFPLPDAESDVAEFLADLLLHGIAAPRTGEAT